jgi:hypothetical protein
MDMATKPMMGTNFMLLNRVLLLVFGGSLVAYPAIATPVNCPAFVQSDSGRHILDNASLYDGPPAQMADLVPEFMVKMDRWNIDHVDPYLVCEFAGTKQTVTFHAVGARVCEAGGKPFQAYCK